MAMAAAEPFAGGRWHRRRPSRSRRSRSRGGEQGVVRDELRSDEHRGAGHDLAAFELDTGQLVVLDHEAGDGYVDEADGAGDQPLTLRDGQGFRERRGAMSPWRLREAPPPEVGDPRIRLKPRRVNGRTVLPLTHPGGIQAWKIVIPKSQSEPKPRTHDGFEWLYVLSGQMRLVMGDQDIVLGIGEAAEFDTQARTGSAAPAKALPRSSASSADRGTDAHPRPGGHLGVSSLRAARKP
jgi:quercetin dioxygenase-like cupin family protein